MRVPCLFFGVGLAHAALSSLVQWSLIILSHPSFFNRRTRRRCAWSRARPAASYSTASTTSAGPSLHCFSPLFVRVACMHTRGEGERRNGLAYRCVPHRNTD